MWQFFHNVNLIFEKPDVSRPPSHVPRGGIPAALEKAVRYRLLNEPGEAEIIRPEGNDDAFLRWNACDRIIMQGR